MLSAQSTGVLCRVGAAVAAVIIFTALSLAITIPAWAQTPSAPSAAQVRPRLHGYLLDDGEFTALDAPGDELATIPFGINNWGQMVGANADVGNTTGSPPLKPSGNACDACLICFCYEHSALMAFTKYG
jgi:hypothetical protein